MARRRKGRKPPDKPRSVERREMVRIRLNKLGLYRREYFDDEGFIQVRLFENSKSDFFSGDHIYHGKNRGLREIEIFIIGYTAGRGLPPW
jgi:hypothetical protein